MPGLAGFASQSNLAPQALDARLEMLKNNMIVPENHVYHDILFGPHTAGTVLCLPDEEKTQTYQNDQGLIAWLDGTLFNRQVLTEQNNWAFENDLDLLTAVVCSPEHRRALSNLDGLFSAVILDAHRNEIHLLTDRYGLRPLYWHTNPHGLCWASEPKTFLQLPDFSANITSETATTFLVTGQLPPNHTWFDNVQQIPPATHLIYNINKGTIRRERYWWWDQIPSRVGTPNTADLVQEFGYLFQEAVMRQLGPKRQGLMLSGGLDSRAVFAALPQAPPVFTFGHTDSDEVRIAENVATVKLAPHTILPLDQDNWLLPRIEAVWWTDGALNLMHMHGVEHFQTIAQTIDTCFNGAGGDGLAGAGHLFEPHQLTDYLAENLHLGLNEHPDVEQQLHKAFKDAQSAHAFYIDWRMRGFTVHGPRMGLYAGVDYRLPFLDNALQEFLFGLPLSVKQNNKLYSQMLLKTFPTYFRDIPWAKTGKPITWSKWAVRSLRAAQKLRPRPSNRSYTNYPDWLRAPLAKQVVNTVLNTTTARYHQIVSPDSFNRLWAEHLEGKDHSEMIGRYLTLELYLRQVYDQQYQTAHEAQGYVSP